MAEQKSIFRNSFDGKGYRLNESKKNFVRFFRWKLYFLIGVLVFLAWDSDHLIYMGLSLPLGGVKQNA